MICFSKVHRINNFNIHTFVFWFEGATVFIVYNIFYIIKLLLTDLFYCEFHMTVGVK